jgi:thymidylate kinase
MLNTNLILVDGLPGSGKSGTAQSLWLHLRDHGYDANWFFEHQSSHPIYRFDNIAKTYRLTARKSKKIHEQALARWERLTDSLLNTRRIVILESTFFQTTIGWLQLMDLSRSEILEYAAKVTEIIRAVNPVLVYLSQEHPAAALRNIRVHRGDWFEELLVTQIAKTPYGRAYDIRNYDAVIDYFLKVRSITDEIYSKCGLTKMNIDTTGRNWNEYLARIADVLCLPPPGTRSVPIGCEDLTGRYRSGMLWRKESIVIAADKQGLYFADEARTRLIHKSGNTFCVQGMCVEFSFTNRGGYAEMISTGDLPSLPRLWKRVEVTPG